MCEKHTAFLWLVMAWMIILACQSPSTQNPVSSQVEGTVYDSLAAQFEIALVYPDSLGDPSVIVKKWIKIALETEDYDWAVEGFSALANHYERRGKEQRDSVLWFLDHAEELADQHLAPTDTVVLDLYQQKSQAYLQRKRFEEFETYMRKEYDIRIQSVPAAHPSFLSYNNTWGFYWMGNGPSMSVDSGLKYMGLALKAAKKKYGPDHPDVGTYHDNYGFCLFRKGDLGIAIGHFRKGVALKEGGTTAMKMANSYNNLGYMLENYGQADSALHYYHLALDIARKSLDESNRLFGFLYSNMGSVLGELGDYEGELDYLRLAEQFYLDNPDLCPNGFCKQLANVYNNMGYAYKGLKLPKTQIFYYEKAIFTYQGVVDRMLLDSNLKAEDRAQLEAGNISEIAAYLHNISIVYEEQGAYLMALEPAKRAFAIRRSLKHQGLDLIKSYRSMGLLYQRLGKPALAKEMLQSGLDSVQSILPPHHAEYMDAYTHMAQWHQEQGDWEGSRSYLDQYRKLLPLNEKGELLPGQLNPDAVESYLSFFEASAEDYLHEFEQYQQTDVLNLVVDQYQLMTEVLSWTLSIQVFDQPKLRLLESYQDKTTAAVALCYELAQRTQLDSWAITALNFAEKSRGAVLGTQIQKDRFLLEAKVPFAIRSLQKELKFRIFANQKRVLDPEDGANKEQLNQRIIRSRRSLDSLNQLVARDYPGYQASLEASWDLTNLSQTQLRSALTDSSLMIQYFLADSQMYVFAFSPDTQVFLRYPISPHFAAELEGFLADVRNPAQSSGSTTNMIALHQEGHDYFQLLLAPVLGMIPAEGIAELILIPDGKLHELPFEVLLTSFNPDQDASKPIPYLFQRYRTRLAFSSSLLVQDAMTGSSSPNATKGYIGYAPSYRLPLQVKQPTEGNLRGDEQACLEEPSYYPPLVFAQQSVRDIASTWEGDSLIGYPAQEAHFKQYAGQYRLIHFSGHTFSCENAPMNAGVIFSAPYDETGSTDEAYGILRSSEIYPLSLSAELIVLMGCNTNRGFLQSGEGVMSLSRAFRHAGCSNLVSSLWPLNDYSTKEFSGLFFHHLHEGHGKAKALQLARKDFLATQPYFSHPAFWAGLVLIGDDAPISSTGSSSSWLNFLGLAGLLLVVIVFIRRTRRR